VRAIYIDEGDARRGGAIRRTDMDEKPLTLTLSPVGGEGNAAWGHAAYNGAGDGGQGRGKVGGGGGYV
jgi:hypothetical protein